MSVPEQQMDELVRSEYKQGFITPIESDTLPPGLDEGVIRAISEKKGEPEWMLEKRLVAYRHWLTMPEPQWSSLHHPPIDFQSISYFSSPRPKDGPKSLDEVDPELLETYEKRLQAYVQPDIEAGVERDLERYIQARTS